MSAKDVFEIIAFCINFIIISTFMLMTVGLIIISGFPDLIQPRGYWRARIRARLKPLLAWLSRQWAFLCDVFDTLCDRQKLEETLAEINSGQRSLPLR